VDGEILMRVWILAIALAGCLRETTFECRTNTDCGAGARCEAVGFCSLPDDTCPTGFRFDDSAGPFADQCVEPTAREAIQPLDMK
jgi:hypothetical protein